MNRILSIAILSLTMLVSACFDEKEISSSQAEAFMKYYNNYPVFEGADVKPLSSSGYALIGTVRISDGSTRICLLKTDDYGNLEDSLYYGAGMNARAHALQVLSDGGFAILGSADNSVTGMREVYFIRTNGQGDTLWTSRIRHLGDTEAQHFEVTSDGSFVMTGYAQSSSLNNNKEVLLAGLDEDGAPLFWSPKIYGAGKDDEGEYIQILDDGSYVITGTTRSYPSGTPYSHAFVAKATVFGGIPGIFTLDASSDEKASCIRVIDNTHFLVLGSTKNPLTGNSNDIMLKKVSLSGFSISTEWTRTFGGTGNDYGVSLLAGSGSIQILGTVGTTLLNTAIELIITDNDGNNPRYSIFGLSTELSGTSMERTDDNGFIISGTNKYSDNSISATLIKTRSDGSL